MEELKAVAEAIDTAMLNGVALKEIGDYSINIIPDDRKIIIYYTKIVAISKIEVKFTLQAAKNIGEAAVARS